MQVWPALPATAGLGVIVAMLCGGCVQRSMVFGQSASMLPPKGAEVTASVGVYNSLTATSADASAGGGTSELTFAILGTEAGLRHGLSERLNIDLHASNAGLQGGLKVRIAPGLALMPQVGGGYWRWKNTTPDGVSSSGSQANLMAGGKVLLGGDRLYGGLGADLQYSRLTGADDPSTDTELHALVAVGYQFRLGSLTLRLEDSMDLSFDDGSSATLILMTSVTAAH